MESSAHLRYGEAKTCIESGRLEGRDGLHVVRALTPDRPGMHAAQKMRADLLTTLDVFTNALNPFLQDKRGDVNCQFPSVV